MSALRICALAVLFAAVAMAAKTGDGCPKDTTYHNLYTNTTGCAAAVTCTTQFDSCKTNGVANCTGAIGCVHKYMLCLVKASENTSCTSYMGLHNSLLAVADGKAYNASNAYKSCKYEACKLLNTTAGTNCTLDYTVLCASPVNFIGSLVLRGFFSAILNNAANAAAFKQGMGRDLAKFFAVKMVEVLRAFVRTARRQAANETLVVEFMVPGLSAKNTALVGKLGRLNNGEAGWLQEALAVYRAVNGASASMTVAGVAVGTGSSAFSDGYPSVTSAPSSGASGSATSAASGSGASGSGVSGSGASGSGTSGSATSGPDGVATHSIIAAIAMAVLFSAMLL